MYADLVHPVTEEAPQLIDVIKDDERFLREEDYALSKSRAERFLRDNPYPKNWTIVRPVISFSDKRLDLVLTNSVDCFREALAKGTPLVLPAEARELTAGLDWAGNTGKLIAHLLFKPECIGEAYTVSSAQNLKWSEVADLYTELLGLEIVWEPVSRGLDDWRWPYDRAYDRSIDNRKILAATGLKKEDFTPIREGLVIELRKLGWI